MATELFSVWGLQTGWRSQRGDGYDVMAELDGIDVWYQGKDVKTVERAFYRACRRIFLRRYLPWLAPPPREFGEDPLETKMTMPEERTRAIIETKLFLEELTSPKSGVPDAAKEHARALLRHYPSLGELELAHMALPMIFGPARKTADVKTAYSK